MEIVSRELQRVIALLGVSGCKPNAKDSYGCRPLHYSAMRGTTDATQALLQLDDIQIEVL